MQFRSFLQTNRVYLDGGTGTLLQQAGLPSSELPERWNVTHPDVIKGIHKAYFDAGSNVVATNTFGANTVKYSQEELERVIRAGIENARTAANDSVGTQEKFVALDIGPTGKLLKPYGTLDFDSAVEIFAQTVRLGVKYGVDLILIETMSDCYETKAAVLAAKENSDLPILVSNAYEGSGKLMTGASALVMTTILEGLGVDGFGMNCSLGPKLLQPVAQEVLNNASLPVLIKPNAGLPITENGVTRYDVDAQMFADEMYGFVALGARIVGGCCGTTPAHIAALVEKTKDLPVQPIADNAKPYVASYIRVANAESGLEGGLETGAAIPSALDVDIDTIIDEAFEQKAEGVEILHVCINGEGAIDSLSFIVESIQEVLDLPICLQSDNLVALEKAMRRYNGKPLIKCGEGQTLSDLLLLVQKYGGVCIR